MEMEITRAQAYEVEAQRQLEALAGVVHTRKVIEDFEKGLRKELAELFETYGIDKFENDFITISKVKGSTSTSIDVRALKANEPELFGELVADYPKVTERKPYVRITVRGE